MNFNQWSVVLRTQALVIFQVSLMIVGFIFVVAGLNAIDDELTQQQQLLQTQQTVLAQQSQSLTQQTNELEKQQVAIDVQNDAIVLQNAAFRVYQSYPLVLYWRLSAATTQLSSDLDNANQAEQTLREAIAEISALDEELAESTDVFLWDLEDFNALVEQARTTIAEGDFVQGQRTLSRTQTQVISMTTMLDVVIEIAQEVVTEASQQVDESSSSLTRSIAQTERDVNAVESSALDVAARIERVSVVSGSINQRILMIVVISVSIVLVVGFLLGRSISRPVNTLQQQIKKVSADSDFTIKADDHRGDEIGAIARSLNTMIVSIRTMIADVRSAADEISDEADMQTRSNTEVQQALDTIMLEVDSVAAAINEMTAAVQGINDLTTQAAEAAASGEQVSLQGSQQVSKSSERVQELNHELMTAEQRLHTLVEHTQKIYAVVDVIQGISEQTNLLALNAAIEAARAGEQGRGFAVVADEVRTLAQRTEQSTVEIKQMVGSFADEVNSTANQVKQSMTYAEASTDAAVSAQQSMDFLLSTVKGIRELNSQISQSTQEQAEATSAVDSSVTRISTLVSDVKERSDNTVSTMARLQEMTDRLDTQVRRFKT